MLENPPLAPLHSSTQAQHSCLHAHHRKECIVAKGLSFSVSGSSQINGQAAACFTRDGDHLNAVMCKLMWPEPHNIKHYATAGFAAGFGA